ncbi:hypothetical protein BRC94_09215 [Halobacteriales archaeon QS_5_70_17]|jgi:hypothetical protein|nr:MAG: hypothetical protein BRC94_09215 [Halobacteriales archaeon QS_5_70_17]
MVAVRPSGEEPPAPAIADYCYPITVIDGELRLVGRPTGGDPIRSGELADRLARELPGIDPATVANGTDVGELRLGEDDDPAGGVVVAYDGAATE